MKCLLVLVLLSVVACSCKGSTPTGAQPTAQIQVTTNPSAITPTVCPPSNCGSVTNQLEAVATVTVRESSGVAGRVDSIQMTLRRNQDASVLASGTVTPSAGSNRFAGNGSVSVPIGVHYDVAHGGSASTLTLAVSGSDDNGHPLSASLTVPVAPYVP